MIDMLKLQGEVNALRLLMAMLLIDGAGKTGDPDAALAALEKRLDVSVNLFKLSGGEAVANERIRESMREFCQSLIATCRENVASPAPPFRSQ